MDRRTFIEGAGMSVAAAVAGLAPASSPVTAAAPDAGASAIVVQPGTPETGALFLRALIVDDALGDGSAYGDAAAALADDIETRGILLERSTSGADAVARIDADMAIDGVLVQANLGGRLAASVVAAVRGRSGDMPLFLLTGDSEDQVSDDLLAGASDVLSLLEDTTDFLGGRVQAAITEWRDALLPPMFSALVEFAGEHEYSWHTPGHTGGTAFLRSPAGRAYHDFFGESLLRNDLSISVGELGSLLDHSGPIGDGERNAARVFGAHRTYFVTNGSSTSNRVILMASVTRDQVTLCDRNCHKSVEHAMTMSGAAPTYLIPTRNGLGIIGPIPPERLDPEAVARAIAENPLTSGLEDRKPVHAVITNSTYDGLCYRVTRVSELLGQSVDRLHFDEAWYGYARFNPLYAGRYGMHGDPESSDPDAPTIFTTQSTHKLLAALSQASMIHVRDGRNAIPHARFNEAYLMHASTSPLYPMIASIDIASAMMDGTEGERLTGLSIRAAVAFRQRVARLHEEAVAAGEWFFQPWQPDTVAVEGQEMAFADAPADLLATDSSCWVLRPGAAWHGFGQFEDGYCLLDPIKVTLLTPGCGADGTLADDGIPAPVVTAFLSARGIVPEKTTDFGMLFLFSMGTTSGKADALIAGLHEFRRAYDANMPLAKALPHLGELIPAYYGRMGLRDLCGEMFASMRTLDITGALARAFSTLPAPKMSPARAYERLVRGETEMVAVAKMAGRVVATGVVPYPPGIPLLRPGEQTGDAESPQLAYLSAMEAFDRQWPGFAHDTHGVEVSGDGAYYVMCLTS